MIKEFEYFHGAAILGIIKSSPSAVSITPLDGFENSAYLINEKVGLYIKYSRKRLSPWGFSFQDNHQETIALLKECYGEVIVLLVCNEDGIVGLNYSDLNSLLDSKIEEIEWIRASRTRGKMYQVTGSDGKLDFKISREDYLTKIFTALGLKERVTFKKSILDPISDEV
jgi:hypothetical protein